MYGAREVSRDLRRWNSTIPFRNWRPAPSLPMPKVYVIDGAQPNAFATGRDPEHAAVAASTGLLNMLSTA